jgi:tRNA(His) guanylyltransferase
MQQSMKSDIFGDRMKSYERAYTSAYVPIDQILCVRIDGKGFSKFTKGFKKPFDDRLGGVMVSTMKKLVEDTHASIGYTSSDEITLIYTPGEKASEYIFGGKTSKINSILASMATHYFNYGLDVYVAVDKPAFFDCRTWAVPDLAEASNVLLWRVQDARKNSISSLFRWTAGHSKMHGLSGEEMKAMLKSDFSTDWDELPNKYKYGTYAKPVKVESYLTQEELMKIPEHKRPEAEVLVKRTKVKELDIGYFGDYTLEQRMEYVK